MDAAVHLARAAIDAARIASEMEDALVLLGAADANAGAAAALPMDVVVQGVDLDENEQQRRDAEYFNAQEGMQMNDMHSDGL